jgi:hypothetical protein
VTGAADNRVDAEPGGATDVPEVEQEHQDSRDPAQTGEGMKSWRTFPQ